MRKIGPPKQGHECCLEGSNALKKVSDGRFPDDRLADQHGQKIDGFIPAETSSYETDLLRKGLKLPFRRQVMGNNDHFGEPRRNRGTSFRRGLDLNTGVGYHMLRDLLLREWFVSFSVEISLFFLRSWLPAISF